MKKVLTYFIVLLIGSFSVVPAVYSADEEVSTNPQEQNEKVKVFVKNISDTVFSIVNNSKIDDRQKEEKLRDFFVNYVDMKWMGKFVLGRYYRSAKEEELKNYLKLYSDYLVYSYVPRFRDFSGQEFSIIKVVAIGDGEYIVYTEIKGPDPNKPSIRVDYRIRNNDGDNYKVIDMIGEGISLITTQRSDFGGLISRKGLNFFIDKLRAKVKKLKKPA